MEEYLNNLKNKFNYSEELITFLSNLIPSMIIYYGKEHEETILSALSNCEIHFQTENEDPEEYLNNYFGINKKWDIPSLGSALYQNEISVKDNHVTARPIIYIKRVFMHHYTPFDFQNAKNANMLIHEICHLIKGYGRLKVENGKIIDPTGLMKDTYSYNSNGEIKEESSDNIGIEEALNEVDAARILEIMTGKKQEIEGYKRAGEIATWLLAHEDIAKVIRFCQFNDSDLWIKYLGKDNAQMLIENFDILVKSLYISFAELTHEKVIELQTKMDAAEIQIYEFTQNYSNNQNLDALMSNKEANSR